MTLDLPTALAAPIPLTIGGREYWFSPLRLRDHAEAAQRMRQGWRSPRDAVRAIGRGLAADAQRRLLELAYRDERRGDPVSLDEVFAWYDTPEGALIHKWLMLRPRHPELTLEQVDELLLAASAEDAARLRDAVERGDGLPAGNSPSPSPPAGTEDATTAGETRRAAAAGTP